jgi:cold shock CspA family protein
MTTGTVFSYFDTGWGFIEADNRERCFYHIRDCDDGYDPRHRDRVTFDVIAPDAPGRSPRAINVRCIAPAEDVPGRTYDSERRITRR